MQIAVCIYGHGLNAGGMEDCFGSFAGSECLTAAAVFQLQVNPFNVMLFQHGVNGAAYLYFFGVPKWVNITLLGLACVKLLLDWMFTVWYRRQY